MGDPWNSVSRLSHTSSLTLTYDGGPRVRIVFEVSTCELSTPFETAFRRSHHPSIWNLVSSLTVLQAGTQASWLWQVRCVGKPAYRISDIPGMFGRVSLTALTTESFPMRCSHRHRRHHHHQRHQGVDVDHRGEACFVNTRFSCQQAKQVCEKVRLYECEV